MKKKKLKYYEAVIFDLDGTLLDTLEDLRAAVNYALTTFDYPTRNAQEVRRFLGEGAGKLIERALPNGMDAADYIPVLTTFKRYYSANCNSKTTIYEGILPLVTELAQRGIPMAVVSNKLDNAVQELCQNFFGDLFQTTIGESAQVRRKPAPDSVLKAAANLGVPASRCVYVGDSEVDIETARNAGLDCISVTWGFRDKHFLDAHGAEYAIDRPEELLEHFPQCPRVLVMDPIEERAVEGVTVEGYETRWSSAPTGEQLNWAQIILGQPSLEQLAQAKNLRWLQSTSAGVDAYVRAENFPAGVALTTSSGAFGKGIAEHVLAVTLSLMKRLPNYRDSQTQATWRDLGAEQSIWQRNVLILGAGDIGRECARLFRFFHCTVTGVRRSSREIPPEFDEMCTLDEAENFLPGADIVVGCLPNTPETQKFLDAKRLKFLKPTAILVNVGRGNLIDCDALAERLRLGKLFGAALDVTDPEPLPVLHPLWRCPNALLTPHISGGSFGHLPETTQRIYAICRENLERFLRDKPLVNQVDFSTGYRRMQERI